MKNNYIFGPSHCVRIKRVIELGVLSFDTPLKNIYGVGGLPIWSKRQLINIQNIIEKSTDSGVCERGGGGIVCCIF